MDGWIQKDTKNIKHKENLSHKANHTRRSKHKHGTHRLGQRRLRQGVEFVEGVQRPAPQQAHLAKSSSDRFGSVGRGGSGMAVSFVLVCVCVRCGWDTKREGKET